MKRALAFLTGLLLCSSFASAQFFDATLSGGYSHFFPDKTGGYSFGKDGAYVDGDFAWRIPQLALPTYVGVGVGGSGYWDSTNYTAIDRFGNLYQTNLWSDIGNYEIEPRLALRIRIPGLQGVFVRPRIGAGLLIDNYSIDTATPQINGFTYFQTYNHTGAAFDIHPSVQVGYSQGPFSIGGEVGYIAAFGGFGALGDVGQELRVGAFITLRY
jgi:hypothetical protein